MTQQPVSYTAVRLALWSSIVLMCVSLMVLIGGWLLNITLFRSVLPNGVSMKVNTALCLCLYGVNLYQWAKKILCNATTRQNYYRILPFIGILISGITLLEYWTSWNSGLDQFFWQDTELKESGHVPGRMALLTANCLFLLGWSLFLAESPRKNLRRVSSILSFAAMAAGMTTILNYIYNTIGLTDLTVTLKGSMALHTALLIFLCGLTNWVLLSRERFISITFTSSASGLMIRTVLPFFLISIPAVQLGLHVARNYGWLSPSMEISLFAVIVLFSLCAIVAGLSQNLYQAEQAIQENHQELKRRIEVGLALNNRLHQQNQILENALEGIAEISADGIYLSVNKAYAETLGYTRAELTGKEWHFNFPHTEQPHARELHRRMLDVGKAEGESLYIRKDGSFIHQQVVMVANYNELDQLIGYFQFTKDITDKKRSDQLLEEAARKFAAIFNQTFQFIGLMTPEGTLLEANLNALEFYGFKSDTILDKPLWEASWWRYSETMQSRLKEAIQKAAQNEFIRFESQHPTIHGNTITLDFSIKPITDEQGNVILLIPEGRDITALKKTQETLQISEERLRMAIECSGQSFWDWNIDPAKTYFDVYWNRENSPPPHGRESSMESWQARVHPDDWERNVMALQAHTQGNTPSYQTEYRQKDDQGGWMWVRSHGRVVERDESGQVSRIIGMTQNITQQKEDEALLQQAKQEAELASQFKSHFLATMSHEIRTPINGILGLTELTLNSELNEEQRDNLEMVYASGHSLLNIVNDILDFSKIEAGKMELSPICFNLRNCVREVTYPFITVAQKKNLALSFDISDNIPALLQGDEPKLKQILNNLLDNALKFTSKGQIALTLTLAEQNQNNVKLQFAIQDTGIGLHDEQKEKIFAPFTQAESSINRRFGGTGLGLSISSQLAELMDGSIEVDSIPNQGSTFTLTLWMKVPAEDEPTRIQEKKTVHKPHHSKSPQVVSANTQKILIVEDNEINLKLAEHILIKAGYESDFAMNGKQALEKVAQKQYDLILMDIHMPELDGFQTTAIIREQEQERRIPIIALTADTVQGYRERCLAAGMDSYLPKPYHKDSLLHEVENLLAPDSTKAQSRHSGQLSPLPNVQSESNWLDFSKILAHCHGDRLLLAKMTPLLEKRTGELLKRIEQNLFEGQLNGIRESAHALKGALGNFTTNGPFSLAHQLEILAQQDQKELIPACLEELQKEIEALKTLLATHLD